MFSGAPQNIGVASVGEKHADMNNANAQTPPSVFDGIDKELGSYIPAINMSNGMIAGLDAQCCFPFSSDKPVDFHSFRRSCSMIVRDLTTWRALGVDLPDRIRVHAGIDTILSPEFLPILHTMLLTNQADLCDRLEIELSAPSDKVQRQGLARTLHTCMVMGIGVTLKDFSAEKGCWACLTELPVTTLKIDTLFINRLEHDTRAQEIVAHLVNLAQELDALPIAQGISNHRQISIAQELGCPVMQGTAIVPYMKVSHFHSWLTRKKLHLAEPRQMAP